MSLNGSISVPDGCHRCFPFFRPPQRAPKHGAATSHGFISSSATPFHVAGHLALHSKVVKPSDHLRNSIAAGYAFDARSRNYAAALPTDLQACALRCPGVPLQGVFTPLPDRRARAVPVVRR